MAATYLPRHPEECLRALTGILESLLDLTTIFPLGRFTFFAQVIKDEATKRVII